MKDFLTPILALALCGTLAMVYFGQDRRCAMGTLGLSDNVRNYINSRAAANSKDAPKAESGSPLRQATEKVLNLNKTVFSLAANVDGYSAIKHLIPAGTFDLDDTPISESERREKTFEIYEMVTSKIRRACREGG